MIYITISTKIQAFKLTKENIAQLEKFCNGSIKGLGLPISQRRIDFYNKEIDAEVQANMGDWIIQHPTLGFMSCSDLFFHKFYREYTKAEEDFMSLY